VCNSNGLTAIIKVFENFLQSLSASKRKMIKRERRRVEEQGITMVAISGLEISELQMAGFFFGFTA